MKIKSIINVGKKNVYDITVDGVHHYVLSNGVVTHNTGLIYSANQAFIISKAQEKDGTDLIGWNFTLNVEKSRFVKEKSKLTFRVLYESGIQKYSGLLELALEAGVVTKPNIGWYSRVDADGVIEEKKYRSKDTDTKEFWDNLLKEERFLSYIKNKFKMINNYKTSSLSNMDNDDATDPLDEPE